jgi:hypothetical protein
LHLLVANWIGAAGRSRKARPGVADLASEAGSGLSDVLARLGPGFKTGDVHHGLPPAILDFAELRKYAKPV